MELINCIRRIPQSLSDVKDKYLIGDGLSFLNSDTTEFKRINIIGSGTSYNAGHVAKYFIENNTDLECRLFYPSIFLNHTNLDLFDNNDLFVFVSQGGKTKLVLDCLEKVKSEGIFTIAISEKLNSPIAKSADICIDMLTYNEEFIFRTIGYSTTSLILCILGLKISNYNKNELDLYIEDLNKVISNLDNIEKISKNWFEKYGENYSKSKNFIFVGNSDLFPVAVEANIKFVEMIPKLCVAYELEELIHGPQNAFKDNISFFFLNNGFEEKKNDAITKFIVNEITNKVVTVGTKDDKHNVNINSVGEYFYYLEYTAFMQYNSYYFAKLNGRDLSKTTYPQLTKYINKSL